MEPVPATSPSIVIKILIFWERDISHHLFITISSSRCSLRSPGIRRKRQGVHNESRQGQKSIPNTRSLTGCSEWPGAKCLCPVSSSLHYLSLSEDKSRSRINFKPAGLLVDRFHLWYVLYQNQSIHSTVFNPIFQFIWEDTISPEAHWS